MLLFFVGWYVVEIGGLSPKNLERGQDLEKGGVTGPGREVAIGHDPKREDGTGQGKEGMISLEKRSGTGQLLKKGRRAHGRKETDHMKEMLAGWKNLQSMEPLIRRKVCTFRS